jgi:hypothetical protein
MVFIHHNYIKLVDLFLEYCENVNCVEIGIRRTIDTHLDIFNINIQLNPGVVFINIIGKRQTTLYLKWSKVDKVYVLSIDNRVACNLVHSSKSEIIQSIIDFSGEGRRCCVFVEKFARIYDSWMDYLYYEYDGNDRGAHGVNDRFVFEDKANVESDRQAAIEEKKAADNAEAIRLLKTLEANHYVATLEKSLASIIEKFDRITSDKRVRPRSKSRSRSRRNRERKHQRSRSKSRSRSRSRRDVRREQERRRDRSRSRSRTRREQDRRRDRSRSPPRRRMRSGTPDRRPKSRSPRRINIDGALTTRRKY